MLRLIGGAAATYLAEHVANLRFVLGVESSAAEHFS